MLRDFKKEVRKLETQNLRRSLQMIGSPCDTTIVIDGSQFILLASNNYLGLANHPDVKKAACKAIEKWGIGAGAARLISGTMEPHQELENQLAQFKQVQATLTFGTGYSANLGIIPSLIGQEGLIFADRYCHASLIEGCRLAKAKLQVFQHNDVEHLEKLLKNRKKTCPALVVTEGVYSMDGDIAPLPNLLELCQTYNAILLVDDAHGTGVMGKNGRGTIEHFGLDPMSLVQMGTLSKAIGASGGYVATSASLREYLINRSKAFIYTTASPPVIAVAASISLQIIQNEPERRKRLWDNRNYLYSELKALGLQLTETQSPILPILIKTPEMALEIARALYKAGIYLPAIRPPTIPKGSSRLRLTVSSEHSQDQLNKVIRTFRKVGEEFSLF